MFAAWYDFNWIPDFMKTNWFLGLMVLLLLVFIGVMFFLRSRRPDDD